MVDVFEVFKNAVMIASFVFVMMLLIEYINVLTRGSWEERLRGHRGSQYLLAVLLGATPGCLGAFAVVAMYSHGSLSLGAVVAAMVATSGDEAFVMLVMIPREALFLFGLLGVLGFAAGALTDSIWGESRTQQSVRSDAFQLHEEAACNCFPRDQILLQWKECTPARGILATGLFVFLVALVGGQIGPTAWNWIRVTLLFTCGVALFIVSTVPDHFLEEHLWRHVAQEHMPRVFLWTFAALIAMYVLTERLHLEHVMWEGRWFVLVIACLIGVIPESGPHLVFVTLYAQGAAPFSILLANSIVQDGHGMLPMLAHSRRESLRIKAVNLLLGFVVGAAAMALGY